MCRARHGPVVGLLFLLCLAPGSLAQQREVWVVNEQSVDISIIDDPLDTPGTIETVSLGGAADPRPYGIAFSTFPNSPGSHVFVSQGRDVRVIEFATRAITSTVDVAALIGRPDAVLKGMDAARPDRFLDAADVPRMRNYLHIAADVRPAVGQPLQPWFIVLDQSALAGLVAAPILVADGPLIPAPPPTLEAMEVRVLGAPAGAAVQRAWYSFRDLADPPAVGAARVVSGSTLFDPWSVDRRIVTPLPPGTNVPASIHPGAPHSRELALLPEGPEGTLLNLDTGKRCAFDGFPRAVSVTGPGIASYDLWVALIDPVGPDLLQHSNWETCTLGTPVPVGQNPVDIDTLGRVEWQEAYVASHDSDSVTIVQAGDPPSWVTIELSVAPAPPCTKCPRSIAVRESPATVCRAVELRAELLEPLNDVIYSWDAVGCELQETFKLWCRCLSPAFQDCPIDCVQGCQAAPGRQTGEVWCEVDVVASDGGDEGGEGTVRGDGDSKTQVSSETNDDAE